MDTNKLKFFKLLSLGPTNPDNDSFEVIVFYYYYIFLVMCQVV